jgi:hypothetical protein
MLRTLCPSHGSGTGSPITVTTNELCWRFWKSDIGSIIIVVIMDRPGTESLQLVRGHWRTQCGSEDGSEMGRMAEVGWQNSTSDFRRHNGTIGWRGVVFHHWPMSALLIDSCSILDRVLFHH